MAHEPVSLEVARIERAITELLEALEADAKKNPSKEFPVIAALFAALRPRKEDDTDRLIQRPVAISCRIGLRLLGRRLVERVGNIDTIMEIAERAAEGPNKADRLVVIADAWKTVLEPFEAPPAKKA